MMQVRITTIDSHLRPKDDLSGIIPGPAGSTLNSESALKAAICVAICKRRKFNIHKCLNIRRLAERSVQSDE